MATLYLTEQRATVHKDAETLVVNIPADPQTGTEKRKVTVPLLKVDQVVVIGNVTVTTPALHALLDNGVAVSFLDYHGEFKGQLAPALSKNAPLRIAQHQVHHDLARRRALAQAFVRGKLTNMRTLLMRTNRKRDDEDIVRAVASLKRVLDQLADAPLEPGMAADPDDRMGGRGDLFGLEGAGSAAYFGVFGRLLTQDLGFAGRVKRPPRDPVNALLSYGYTILTHKVASAVSTVGLDPYVGYLHGSQYGQPALALDVVEEFRPVVVDSVVLTLLNNRSLTADDFREELGVYRLTDAGRRTFFQRFEERLNTSVKHPVFGYSATYARCLELQVRLVAKTVLGEIPAYEPFIVR